MEESDKVQLLRSWQTNVRKIFLPLCLNDEVSSPHRSSAWRYRQNILSNELHPGRHGRSNSSKKQCFVNLFCILILFSSNVTCQGVTVTSGPQNQTIVEGGSVRFECIYEGSDRVPSWRINTTIYSNSQLPGEYELDDQDFSLTVQSVSTSLNNTSFQCIIGIYFSEKGYLFVEPIEKNTTDCDQCNPVQIMSTSTSEQLATSTFVVTENTAATSENLQRSDKISASLVVIVTVTVSVSLLLCVFVIIGSLLCLKQSSKKRKASTRAADIEVKENEAYVAVENYRKPIRIERNKAYEITNIVPNRSRSPQA